MRSGAIGLRIERVVERVEKPVWCVEYRDRVVEANSSRAGVVSQAQETILAEE